MADSKGNGLERFLFPSKDKASPDPEPTPETPEDSESLAIKQMNGQYSAVRPANKNLTRMHIVKKDGTVETVQYHFSDVKGVFRGSEFEVIFAGTKHWKITVKGSGPKFWAIYDYITLHRWPYLREATEHEGKFAGNDETVLTEIRITDVTPKSDE